RAHRLPRDADRGGRRRGRRGPAGGLGRRRRGPARAGDPRRGLAHRGEVREADPLRRPARRPLRLVPRRRRGPRGQGHPLGGAGGRRPRDVGAAGGGPAPGGAHRRGL
ncbi:MAG: Histidyl-tRNA synthetase, partial [uncultured Quadrisphaera sp.]